MAIYSFDLDYIKELNDTLGYSVGDKLIKASGERLKGFIEANTFIARLSGDMFLVLQYGIDTKASINKFAERLIHCFQDPVKINDCEIYTSISIGISLFPQNGLTADDLIKHANSALLSIKDTYRNCYKLFETSISEKFKSLLTMENQLRKAIIGGQFELYYQPQVDFTSSRIIGVEALLRWRHPEKGYISPRDFISIAEKTGIIIDIGEWVLHEACRQNKKWQDEGLTPIVVSVNLSAVQLHQKGFVGKIKKILNETNLDAKYLELEITESMAMKNEQSILDILQELRSEGILVAIDDFGTGYSSLKSLSLFPITKLKIDKMFMNKQDENRLIVKSIIQLSHSLNMKVIAEGVETKEQFTFLQQEKCDEMQGYFFSRPVPAYQLKEMLLNDN
ncbi:hypothetical protein GCM10008934_39090 [Virgibacillus salarius]